MQFDSPSARDEHTRRLVKALRTKKRDVLLAAVLYRHGGELRTTEADLRHMLTAVGPWQLTLYIDTLARDVILRLETQKGHVLYGSESGCGIRITGPGVPGLDRE